jgi:TPR repeat protein
LRCKLCDPFWDWFWETSDAWDVAHSNEHQLWSRESERSRELIGRALAEGDASASFQLFLGAADAGSARAMDRVAWHYETGTGVPVDTNRALEYYRLAICAGSWRATLDYSRLLAKFGYVEASDKVLQDGVSLGFEPAYFWLAWRRYKRRPSRKMAAEVLPLLEHAAAKGHPAAKFFLARWMLTGRFGAREIFRGAKLLLQCMRDAKIQLARDAAKDGALPRTSGRASGRAQA